MEYSIVIPVYNSTDSISELTHRLRKVLIEELNSSFEIILIDDSSPNPNTWKTLTGLADQFQDVKCIQLRKNFGKAGAILCGFNEAIGNYVFTLDDDLQHIPENIPRFIKHKSHDVVMGLYLKKQHPLSKKLTSKVKAWFDNKITGKPTHLISNPFRMYKSEVVKLMVEMESPHPFISAMMYYLTSDIVTVDIEHAPRLGEKSKFSFRKRLSSFTNLLFNHSSFLLRVIAGIGIFVSILSFILGLFYLLKTYFLGRPIPGWTSLIVIVLFTNGLVLLSVGVIGEYLIRIIKGVEKRRPYIVGKKYSWDEME